MADCGRPDHEIEVFNEVALRSQSAALRSKNATRLDVNLHEIDAHKESLKRLLVTLRIRRIQDTFVKLGQGNHTYSDALR